MTVATDPAQQQNACPVFALGPPLLPYWMTGIFRRHLTVWTGIALPVGERR